MHWSLHCHDEEDCRVKHGRYEYEDRCGIRIEFERTELERLSVPREAPTCSYQAGSADEGFVVDFLFLFETAARKAHLGQADRTRNGLSR